MDIRTEHHGEYLISVIIVTYQSASYISYCLESLLRSEGVSLEIIVIDNCSTDQTRTIIKDRYPTVHLISNAENEGFAKACNIGAKKAKGDFLVFLNPDCIIGEESLAMLVGEAHKTTVGLVGPLLIDGSGKLLPESARNLPNSLSALTKVLKLPLSKAAPYYATIETDGPFPAPVLCGACMCIEKSKYETVGGFDESYFMYGEDVDLSVRLIHAGYQNICESGTCIIHFKGESADKGSIEHHQHFYKALELYHAKHVSSTSVVQSMGVSLLSGGLARQRYLFFHFRKWFSALLDGILILGILLFIQFAWSYIKSGSIDYYGYLKYIDRYILSSLLWVIVLGLSGVYHEGPKRKRAFLGGLIGGILVIGLYALLPIDLRFSRMITFLSAILVPVGLLARYGASRKLKSYVVQHEKVTSSLEGYDLIALHQIPKLHSSDEVIWPFGVVPITTMLKTMKSSSCSHRFYDAVQDAMWNSSDPETEGYYSASALPITITSPVHQFQKRIWDIIIAFLLIVLSIILQLLWRKSSFQNIKQLILGRKTLVGYDDSLSVELPETKPYLITCYPGLKKDQIITQRAIQYVTNYSVFDDIFISVTAPLRIVASLM